MKTISVACFLFLRQHGSLAGVDHNSSADKAFAI